MKLVFLCIRVSGSFCRGGGGVIATLFELEDLGQSVWSDQLHRSFLVSGELDKLVSIGLRGVTSNLCLIEKALVGSEDYDDDIGELIRDGLSVEKVFDVMSYRDAAAAADMLKPIYDASGGMDGFVSVEIHPEDPYDTETIIRAGMSIVSRLQHRNVMVEVPATSAGFAAEAELIGNGISVNVKLISSLEKYRRAVESYFQGIEMLLERGLSPERVTSVASVIVRSLDRETDRVLDEMGYGDLRGKAALANCNLIYREYERLFGSDLFMKFAGNGVRRQRILWTDTCEENPDYLSLPYAEKLVYPGTIKVMSPDTLSSFLLHGRISESERFEVEESWNFIEMLDDMINLRRISDYLVGEGAARSLKLYQSILAGIRVKAEMYREEFSIVGRD